MIALLLYLIVGGLLAGFTIEEGDDDGVYLTALASAALWPAATAMIAVIKLRRMW